MDTTDISSTRRCPTTAIGGRFRKFLRAVSVREDLGQRAARAGRIRQTARILQPHQQLGHSGQSGRSAYSGTNRGQPRWLRRQRTHQAQAGSFQPHPLRGGTGLEVVPRPVIRRAARARSPGPATGPLLRTNPMCRLAANPAAAARSWQGWSGACPRPASPRRIPPPSSPAPAGNADRFGEHERHERAAREPRSVLADPPSPRARSPRPPRTNG